MVTTRIIFPLFFSAWLVASIAGMTTLWDHEARPGLAAEAPLQWPSDSALVQAHSRSTLLVWIHPRCPCSRSTVSELERLLVHVPEQVDCRVLLSQPKGCEDAFVETELSRAVRQLPNVSVVVDRDQRAAERFGVSTSGQVLLYDEHAKLLFAGGITPGRGHEGDSVGAMTLRSIFRIDPLDSVNQRCDAFGCGLFELTENQESSP
jgi:hypothetical protein